MMYRNHSENRVTVFLRQRLKWCHIQHFLCVCLCVLHFTLLPFYNLNAFVRLFVYIHLNWLWGLSLHLMYSVVLSHFCLFAPKKIAFDTHSSCIYSIHQQPIKRLWIETEIIGALFAAFNRVLFAIYRCVFVSGTKNLSTDFCSATIWQTLFVAAQNGLSIRSQCQTLPP